MYIVKLFHLRCHTSLFSWMLFLFIGFSNVIPAEAHVDKEIVDNSMLLLAPCFSAGTR